MWNQEHNTNQPSNTTAHPDDWEAQRESLSAYIDGQLAPGERAALEEHIATCARCAAEIGDLRRTVRLLRALPAPALPRSFALPESATQPVPARPATLRPPRRSARAARSAPWAGVAQWVGGLAAVAGLLILFSGALSGLPLGGHQTAAGMSAAPDNVAHSPVSDRSATMAPTTQGTYGANQSATGTPANTAIGTGTPPGQTSVPSPTQAGERQPPSTFDRARAAPAPILPLAGGGLALGGGLVFVAGSLARRRAQVVGRSH